jgi:hypothetical protein
MCMFVLARLDQHLRPLRSAFHNAPCATFPFEEVKKNQIMSEILDWANNSRPVHDRTPVFLMHGGSRSATTTIAHSVMRHARSENRLLASYFVSWNGEAKQRDPADLIPTIIYQFAQFDKTLLHSIAKAVVVDRDARDRDIIAQIRTLFDLSLNNVIMPSGPSTLVVIDALDACYGVDDTGVASGISSFIAKLTGKTSLRIKLLITCTSARIVKRILELPGSPVVYRSYVLVHHWQQDETLSVSYSDRGQCKNLICDRQYD